ncbi:MAG: rRNA maturation RNase YbeY [Anaerolineales bacterium]|nr:rRNA maturation RNase YbeY [Anaerolineales bacterium]
MIHLKIAPCLAIPQLAELKRGLRQAARQALRAAGASTPCDLSVVITGEAQIQELNRQFMGIDAPTDVLAFPSGETDLDSRRAYLGDILIAYPKAVAQAAAGGHSLEDELRLLLVHGCLHLLGYDHTGTEDKARMWAKQGEILELLGSRVTAP